MNDPLVYKGIWFYQSSYGDSWDRVEKARVVVKDKAAPSKEMDQPFNIGNPEERTVRDLATKILALTGSSSRIEYHDLPVDDPHVRCPDITRAKSILGWQPVISIDEGLQHTIDYFRRLTS